MSGKHNPLMCTQEQNYPCYFCVNETLKMDGKMDDIWIINMNMRITNEKQFWKCTKSNKKLCKILEKSDTRWQWSHQ